MKLREEGRERQREELMVEAANLRVKLQSARQQHQEEVVRLQEQNLER